MVGASHINNTTNTSYYLENHLSPGKLGVSAVSVVLLLVWASSLLLLTNEVGQVVR